MASRATVLRNAGLVAAAFLAVLSAWEAWVLVTGIRHDHVQADRATYLGTLIAVLTAVVTIVARAVYGSGDPVQRLQGRLAVNISNRLEHLRLTSHEIDLLVQTSSTGNCRACSSSSMQCPVAGSGGCC